MEEQLIIAVHGYPEIYALSSGTTYGDALGWSLEELSLIQDIAKYKVPDPVKREPALPFQTLAECRKWD